MCVTAEFYFDPRRNIYKPWDALLLESFHQKTQAKILPKKKKQIKNERYIWAAKVSINGG